VAITKNAPEGLMRRVLFALMLAGVIGCEKGPISWSDVSYELIDSKGMAVVSGEVPDSAGCRNRPPGVRFDADTYVVWWSIRSDSSAVLKHAIKNRGQWSDPVSIDTTDRSHRGCDRPPPAFTMDKARQMYVAYFLEPPGGSGIFFSHKMDSTGFHDPVSIAYGKRASAAAVAAHGDDIAVAYEEPNSERGQIFVALSRSMGHIFEHRVPVSSPSEIASNPSVTFRGTKLVVSWLEMIQTGPVGRMRAAERTGTWK
jgi:hypothetical protein